MIKKTQSISKEERLKSTKAFASLFREGNSVKAFPIRLVYRFQAIDSEAKPLIKIGFVASKKKFRHAVHRNRIKRLMRETYRTNKLPLLEVCRVHNQRIEGLLIFTGSELPNLKQLQKSWLKMISRFPSVE